jgi:hypothetical protein
VGDFDRPSVSKRFRRLRQSNYHQILFAKKIAERVLLSADYTAESGVHTFRQAALVQTRGLSVVDVFHFETYQVARADAGYGFAAYGEKKLQLTPEFSISTAWTQAIHNNPDSSPRTRFDLALNYDLLHTLRVASPGLP